MLAKNMLAKPRDELLTQNKKSQNGKTIMVSTWHPALKYLSKVFQEIYHQHIENDLYLKKVLPEKPIIAFRKMKSIRIYIARTDIKEADDQKRLKCHLFSTDKTLKNIHNGKKIKKLDGGNCRKPNIVYAAKSKIHGDIYIGNTGEELRERFSKHRYDAKNSPDSNELAAYIHKHQHEFDKDIEVLILKGNLHQKYERELWEDKFICLKATYNN